MKIEDVIARADSLGFKKFAQGEKLTDFEEEFLFLAKRYVEMARGLEDARTSVSLALAALEKAGGKRQESEG